MGFREAAKEAIYLRRFLSDLEFKNLGNITVFKDNRSALTLAENPIFHPSSTDYMLADILTKNSPKPKHELCMEILGMGTSLKKKTSCLKGKC